MSKSDRVSLNLGTFDGEYGEKRNKVRLTETRISIGLNGPTERDGGHFVDIALTAEMPAAFDKEIRAEIPMFKIKQLRDELDRVINNMEK